MRVVLEALIGRMERTDPTKEEQGLVRTSPSTPSPPGAWVNHLIKVFIMQSYFSLLFIYVVIQQTPNRITYDQDSFLVEDFGQRTLVLHLVTMT